MVVVSMIGNEEEHNDCHHTGIVMNRCFSADIGRGVQKLNLVRVLRFGLLQYDVS